MELIKSNRIIWLIKSNQGMVLIRSIRYIQSWHLLRCSITTDDMTLNSNKQDTE